MIAHRSCIVHHSQVPLDILSSYRPASKDLFPLEPLIAAALADAARADAVPATLADAVPAVAAAASTAAAATAPPPVVRTVPGFPFRHGVVALPRRRSFEVLSKEASV